MKHCPSQTTLCRLPNSFPEYSTSFLNQVIFKKVKKEEVDTGKKGEAPAFP